MVVTRTLLYEGKAKQVFQTDHPDQVVFQYKDDATAFNGEKHETFLGKGELNNRLSAHLLQEVARRGVPTHFIELLSPRQQVCRNVSIIPLEVILRNRAAGSMARRLGLEEGTPLQSTIVEFSYKNDDLGDPLIAAEHAVAIGITTYREIGIMERYTRRINHILQDVFLPVGIELIDFKVEYGRTAEGEVILADEISPDTCRLWDTTTQERLDKDRFRNNLAPLLEGYQEVLRRLESSQKENA